MCSNSRFDLHTPKALDHCFRVQQRHVLRLQYSGAVLTKESSGLSKEACLYADADWLKLICQSKDGDRSVRRLDIASPAQLVFLGTAIYPKSARERF